MDGRELPEAVRAEVQQLAEKGGRVRLNDRTVHFAAPFERKGHVYAWALLGEKPPSAHQRPCPAKAKVDLRQCRPAWICAPVQDGQVGVLGVSHRAATLPRQFELASRNALKLLEYTYGVRVKGQERFLEQSDAVGGIRLRSSAFQVSGQKGGSEDIRLYPKELRRQGGVLYVWLVSPDLPPYTVPQDIDWTRSAPGGVEEGAVGMSRRTADSLLSSQIERAFEKGVFALAKNQGAHIETVEHLRRGSRGRYFLRGVSTQVDTEIQARMRGFYRHPDGRVFVWVVPKTGVSPGK
jgi:hypothetical protein